MEYDTSETFGPVLQPLVNVVAELQRMLVSLSIPFLHPNDILLIGKYEDDTYIKIEAEIVEAGILIHLNVIGQTSIITPILNNKISEIV